MDLRDLEERNFWTAPNQQTTQLEDHRGRLQFGPVKLQTSTTITCNHFCYQPKMEKVPALACVCFPFFLFFSFCFLVCVFSFLFSFLLGQKNTLSFSRLPGFFFLANSRLPGIYSERKVICQGENLYLPPLNLSRSNIISVLFFLVLFYFPCRLSCFYSVVHCDSQIPEILVQKKVESSLESKKKIPTRKPMLFP